MPWSFQGRADIQRQTHPIQALCLQKQTLRRGEEERRRKGNSKWPTVELMCQDPKGQ